MRVHILYEFKDHPWGGANQFLKGLKQYFLLQGMYAENPNSAEIILLNSHHHLRSMLRVKKQHPKLICIHRIDGPIFAVRDRDLHIDKLVFRVNREVADGTIFQSSWSKNENYRFGLKTNAFETVILNAPDPVIFNRDGKTPFFPDRKIRLIATSWSSNWKKGFHAYQWLDEHLDFEKYEMAFIGNSPIQFKKITHIQPLPSQALAHKLKESDIFLTASQKDPCSNALIEALHCGLPALVYNDGGHPEIVGKGGVWFNQPEEIPGLLEQMIQNYSAYQRGIKLPTIDEIGQAYSNFMDSIYTDVQKGTYTPKSFSLLRYLQILGLIGVWKANERWIALKRKFC